MSTSIDAISSGLSVETTDWSCPLCPACAYEPWRIGTPSTTYSGWLPALSDAGPRTRTDTPLPGSPEFCTTCTPAMRPCSALSMLATGTRANAVESTDAMALLTSARWLLP